jgi:peptidyl-prolyl cis-trans isomerase C
MRASKLFTAGAAGIALFATTWHARIVHADVSADEVTIVARVGSRTISAADVSRRIAQLPPFQLRAFGRTPDEVRRAFVDKVMVREALLAQGAIDLKLGERDEVGERVRGVLRNATLGQVRAESGSTGPVSDAEVKAYYEANASKYHAPARVQVWRIQVAKRDEALSILTELKKDPTPKHWNELAREQSTDRATNLRGGNLGFVAPDGTTSEAGLKVDAAILAAVNGAKDGELLQVPVQDGERFSVVWRRNSMKPVDRDLATEAPLIKPILQHERGETKARLLVERLRAEHMTEFNPDAVDLIEVSNTGDLQPIRRPGTMQTRKPLGAQPIPVPGSMR